MAGCCRGTCSGEHCCINQYEGPGNVSFSYDLPGDTKPFLVSPEVGWYMMRGSFVAGTSNLLVGSKFSGCNICCASSCCPQCIGLGAFFTRISATEGTAVAFASAFGHLQRHEVAAGQALYIGGNNFFAANDTMQLEVGFAGPGCTQWCCSGEGMMVKAMGPGVVFTHNRDETPLRTLLFPPAWKAAFDILNGILGGAAGGGKGGGGGASA